MTRFESCSNYKRNLNKRTIETNRRNEQKKQTEEIIDLEGMEQSMMQFKHYPLERLLIERIDSRLNSEEKVVRKWLLDYTIRMGTPFLSGDPVLQAAFPKFNITDILNKLAEKNAVVRDEDGSINFLYPVSALPTNHQVTLADERQFFSMCAVDSMGTAFTFQQDVSINSQCSQCGEPIHVEIQDGKISQLAPGSLRVLHVDLKNSDNWAGSC